MTAPLRILHVNSLAGAGGGTEVYCKAVMAELERLGHTVAFFGGDSQQEERSERRRVVLRPDFHGAHLVHDPELESAFAEFAQSFRPDLVHLHNTHQLSVGLYPLVAQLGAAVVQTAHDFGYLCPNSWCTWADGTVCAGGPGKKCFEHGCEKNYPYDGRIVLAWKLRYETMKRCVQAFPCPSQFLADKLTSHGFPGAFGLPLWTEGGEDAPRSPDALAPHDPLAVLFLGRLVPEKGVEYLVRAWPHVLRRFPGATLRIVGGGPDAERLAALAGELGLDAAGIFLGRVPHSEVGAHLSRAALQVLPSIWCENSPVTTYESYALGLPMVASDIAGLPAMVRSGETGLLARPRDPADIADKICQILSSPDLRRQLSQGCLDAARRFTKERHMERLLALYTECLETAPPRGDADTDLLAASHSFLTRFGEVESWALGMHKHIQWLEGKKS